MRHRPVYRGDGWVLAICTRCQRTNYVEPHGTTAMCLCAKGLMMEHTSIPETQRVDGLMGPFVLVDTHNRLTRIEDDAQKKQGTQPPSRARRPRQ